MNVSRADAHTGLPTQPDAFRPARRAGRGMKALLLAGLLAAAPAAAQQSIDSVTTGFLTPTTGGLPTASWSGTSLTTAKQLVAALPAAPRSRALRDLQFQVMVSELTPPPLDGSPSPSLFARRVEKLAAMGEGENLNELVRSAGAYENPPLTSLTANALMMSGERVSGCTVVRNQGQTPEFARRAVPVCMVVAGQMSEAQAAVAGLRSSDPDLAAMIQIAASGARAGAVPQGPLDGPAMVMFDLSGVRPPAAALQSTLPPVIRALVADRSLPIVTRIEIAERGEALAIIEVTRLSDLYVQAVQSGAALPPAMARRAQLVAAARNAAGGPELMQSVVAVYGESRGSPLFPTIARASAGALINLPAKPEYANVAQEAIRGFLLLGDKNQAQAWTKLALSAAFNNARALAAVDRLLPLVAVAGIDNPRSFPASELNRWYEVMQQDDPARAPLRGNLMLELLRATGIDVPQGSTNLPETVSGGPRGAPRADVMQSLRAAADQRRRAETALLASIAIGETALADLPPAAVGQIVRSVRASGDDQAARLFAIEVAIAYGL